MRGGCKWARIEGPQGPKIIHVISDGAHCNLTLTASHRMWLRNPMVPSSLCPKLSPAACLRVGVGWTILVV